MTLVFLETNPPETGVTFYGVLSNRDGQAWRVTGTPAFATYTTTRSDFVVAASEIGVTGRYSLTIPATVPACHLYVAWFKQAGGSPDHNNDELYMVEDGEWDGAAFSTGAVTLSQENIDAIATGISGSLNFGDVTIEVPR